MQNNYMNEDVMNFNMQQQQMQNNVQSMQQYEQNVTSIDCLKSYCSGSVVRLPDFAKGQPFYARLKRPSLLKLVKNGKIPNALLTTANKLFFSSVDEKDTNSGDTMSNMFKVMDAICEASFVEPTYKELTENGIELTDEQYMFIFNYSQTGIDDLKPNGGQQ